MVYRLVFNKTFQVIVKWLILVCATIYLLSLTDTLNVLALMQNVDGFYFLLFMLTGFFLRLFNAFRIIQVCDFLSTSHQLDLKKSFRIFLFAEFVSVVIPATYSAEAVRIYKLSRCNMGVKQSSLAVLMDRIVGLFVLTFATFLVFLVVGSIPLDIKFFNEELNIVIFSISIAVSGILVVITYYLRESLVKWSLIFKDFFQPNKIFKLLATSLLVYASAVASYYYAFRTSGVDIEVTFVVYIVVLSVLARLVPFSILGVSAGEITLVVVSRYFGVSHELALTTAMIIICGKYIFSVCGILLELYCDGIAVVSESLKITEKNI